MEQLFTVMSKAIEGSVGVALWAAFVWGILSVVLSPCHLSSIPLIIGFISGQGVNDRGGALKTSSMFALGILITIALIGVITAAMGRMYGDLGGYVTYFMVALFLILGLAMIGIIPMPSSISGRVTGYKGRGLLGAFILGLVFGVALGPCTFAFMGPVLGVSFAAAKKHMLFSIALLALYGIGHCAVIVFAGTSVGAVQRYLNWNEKSHGAVILRRICGVLVIYGAYVIYAART
ncbi:MAG: cytochrome c biogenesis protein CcdA [Armatimonadetes bacterium]|nr:cytochrome c biogenesis protein CcdA [Armatimonadota bacterium]